MGKERIDPVPVEPKRPRPEADARQPTRSRPSSHGFLAQPEQFGDLAAREESPTLPIVIVFLHTNHERRRGFPRGCGLRPMESGGFSKKIRANPRGPQSAAGDPSSRMALRHSRPARGLFFPPSRHLRNALVYRTQVSKSGGSAFSYAGHPWSVILSC